MMIGERAVRFTEEGDHFGPQRLEGGNRNQARDSVAAIHHYPNRAGQAMPRHDCLTIGGKHRSVGCFAALPECHRSVTIASQRC